MMARREVARSKARFALFTAAVGLLVFLILFFEVILGSLVTSFVGAIEGQSAPVLVYGRDARRNIAGSVVTPEQLDVVSSIDGVERAAPLGEAAFTLLADGVEVDASVFGFQLDGPGTPIRLVEGRLPSAPGEAVASKEDEDSGFGIGSLVTTASPNEAIDADGAADGSSSPTSALRIVGLTERSRYSVAPTLWISFDDYVSLRKAVNPDAASVLASVIAVEPVEGVTPESVVEAINEGVDGVVAMTRADAASQAPAVAQVVRSVSMILALSFMIVTLVIGFFFLILTVQKRQSLTLLRAIGAPLWYLVGGLVGQVVFVAIGGLVIGWGLMIVSINASSGKVPLTVDYRLAALTSVAVVVFALIGSSVTMWRTLRLDPASAIAPHGVSGLA